jgi:hypothetical protein
MATHLEARVMPSHDFFLIPQCAIPLLPLATVCGNLGSPVLQSFLVIASMQKKTTA